jgi:hypothetical protein
MSRMFRRVFRPIARIPQHCDPRCSRNDLFEKLHPLAGHVSGERRGEAPSRGECSEPDLRLHLLDECRPAAPSRWR